MRDHRILTSSFDHEILNLFIDRWGLDAAIHVASWSIVGLGIGCLIGYLTKSAFVIKEKENK